MCGKLMHVKDADRIRQRWLNRNEAAHLACGGEEKCPWGLQLFCSKIMIITNHRKI